MALLLLLLALPRRARRRRRRPRRALRILVEKDMRSHLVKMRRTRRD